MLSLLALALLLGRVQPQAAVPALARAGGSQRGGRAAAPAPRLPSAFWEGILRDALPLLTRGPATPGGLGGLLRQAAGQAPYALLRATLPGLAAVPGDPPTAGPSRPPAAGGGQVAPAAAAPGTAAAGARRTRARTVPVVSHASRTRTVSRPEPGSPAPEPGTTVCGDKPVVLVYQTHAEESFLPVLGRHATPGAAFSDDPSKNVVRVGDELASALCASGVSVVHLRVRFDMEGRIGAYTRSLAAERAAMKRWPSLRVLLDVHRDEAPLAATTAAVAGLPAARVLIVVGGDATLPDPRWRQNAAWATRVYRALSAAYPGLARSSAGRPYFEGAGRFNQQLSPAALLFEIGGEENTMAEELRGARLLGRTLAGLIQAGEYPR